MDFHSLKRRELQALCKMNKIPANITNIAMADALSALDIVQGIEEFLNPSSVESPEKKVKASPCVPRTGGRTTARRKPVNEDAESVQISTRARRGTKKAIAEEGESAKIDADETPGIKSTRKRGTVPLGLQKMETPGNQKEEVSVQKMYSRRSTRLLDKKMMGLDWNDEGGIEPIDFGGSDKDMANEIKGNVKESSDDLGAVLEAEGNGSGLNEDTPSSDLVKTDLEDLLDKKSDDFSENAREQEQTSEVLDESDDVLVSENTIKFVPEMDEDVDDEDGDANKGLDQDTTSNDLGRTGLDDLLDKKSVDLSENAGELEQTSEALDESDVVLVSEENLVKFAPEMGKGVDDDVEDNKDGDGGVGSEGYAGSDILSDIMEIDDIANEEDFVTLNLSFSAAAEDQKQDNELQNLAMIESDMSVKHPEVEFDHSKNSIGSNQLENEEEEEEEEVTQVTPKGGEESDQLVMESSNEIGSTVIEGKAIDCLPLTDSQMSSCAVICESDVSDRVTPQDIPNFVDHMAADPSAFSFPSDKTPSAELTAEMPFSTLEADPLPEQMSSGLLQSNSDRVICPASVTTPRKKSSIKTPTTSRKNSILLDEKKENIDNSGRKLDLTKEKGKKEKNDAKDSLNNKSLTQLKKIYAESLTPTTNRKISIHLGENKENIDNSGRKFDLTEKKGKKEKNDAKDLLNGKSLTQLRKMFAEKMQITSKKNVQEEKDTAKVGKARSALQTLPENRLAASESEIEI